VEEVFLVAALRSPFGRLQGSLSNVRIDDLLMQIVVELMRRQPEAAQFEDAFFYAGCANQAGEDNRNFARQVVLLSGLPDTTLGTTFNALCNSGIEALLAGIRAIQTGATGLAWVAAAENMSRSPYILHRQTGEQVDSLLGWRYVNANMPSRHTFSMVELAEMAAQKAGISRQAQDEYAQNSRLRYAAALDSDYFAAEILPIATANEKYFSIDEQHRLFNAEALARMPSLSKLGKSITLGNSARAGDGAVALLLVSGSTLDKLHLRPRARLVAATQATLSPDSMNAAAAAATRRLLSKTNANINHFDCIELSESFALQPLTFFAQFPELNPAVCNRAGGSISIGNPTSAGNLRLITALLSHFEHFPNYRQGLVATCSGLGLGAALHWESEL
jgi:acetyl-CoA acetyltransferase family protein